MDQLIRSPKNVSVVLSRSKLQACVQFGGAFVKAQLEHRNSVCPDRAPVSVSSLHALQEKIRKIEQSAISFDQPSCISDHLPWTLGIPGLDNALGGDSNFEGLEGGCVHEIKPSIALNYSTISAAASSAVALGFALRLAVRRFITSQRQSSVNTLLVWCQTKSSAAEIGNLYGPGLAELGLDVSKILFVETTRQSDVLWAVEEALKSGAASLVMGVLDEVNLMEARRLSLAVQTQKTPCLLVTHRARGSCLSAATRWRVGLRASTPNDLDPQSSGRFAMNVTLDRCRRNPSLTQSVPLALEWCHETYRFDMSSSLVHGSSRWSDDKAAYWEKHQA